MSDTKPDLSRDPAALQVRRRPLMRQVAFARESGQWGTLEGCVAYDTGDALVTGEQGERWPVRREQFLQSYKPEPPLVAGEDGRYRRVELKLLAKRLDQALGVEVGPGRGQLHGAPGDWLVQHEDGSLGIVSGTRFAEMYDVL